MFTLKIIKEGSTIESNINLGESYQIVKRQPGDSFERDCSFLLGKDFKPSQDLTAVIVSDNGAIHLCNSDNSYLILNGVGSEIERIICK